MKVKSHEVKILGSARLDSLASRKERTELEAEADAWDSSDNSAYDAFRLGIALALYAQWRPIFMIETDWGGGDFQYYFVGTEAEIEARLKELPDREDYEPDESDEPPIQQLIKPQYRQYVKPQYFSSRRDEEDEQFWRDEKTY